MKKKKNNTNILSKDIRKISKRCCQGINNVPETLTELCDLLKPENKISPGRERERKKHLAYSRRTEREREIKKPDKMLMKGREKMT